MALSLWMAADHQPPNHWPNLDIQAFPVFLVGVAIVADLLVLRTCANWTHGKWEARHNKRRNHGWRGFARVVET